MDISPHLLSVILQHASELGAKQALVKTGKIKPYLTKNESFRQFGRKNVEHWIEDGLITIRKDGNHSATWRIDRMELETIATAKTLLQLL